jgi:cobalamin biosynthesis Mg chelatase CobN
MQQQMLRMEVQGVHEGSKTMDPTQEEGLVAKRTEQYLQIKAKLTKMDEENEEKKKPLTEIKALLEGYFEKVLTQTGVQTLVSKTGTIHWNNRKTCSLEDPQAFMDFVTQNNLFDLLDRRANGTAVREYAKEHGTLPPGAKLGSIRTIGARKPGEKAKRGED